MGDIKRKRKLYKRPRKPFELERIQGENKIAEKYGLKNKREIWKANSMVSKLRNRAKELIPKPQEEKDKFFEKLRKEGYIITNISDVLALKTEDLLDKRLQTFVLKKGLANTTKQARQLIAHKYILVDGKMVNSPSFHITKDLENKIELKEGKRKVEKAQEEKENEEEEAENE